MNAGTSMCVGQAMVQGASWQNRHWLASSSAASFVSGGAMSAKLVASCASLSTDPTLSTGTGPYVGRTAQYCAVSAPLSHAHSNYVDEGRDQEAHKPRPVVHRAEQTGGRHALQRRDKTGKARRDAEGECHHRHPIDPVRVLVRAMPLVEIVHHEHPTPQHEVIGDHDPGDRAEKRTVADEPGDDVYDSVVIDL